MRKVKLTSIVLIVLGMFALGDQKVYANEFQEYIEPDSTLGYSDSVFTEQDIEKITNMDAGETITYAKVALDFAKSVKPSQEFVVSEMIPIYTIEKEFIGYNCKIVSDGKNNGYVIVDSRLKGDYIAEFNLDENAQDLFSSMVEGVSDLSESIEKQADNISNDDKIIIEKEVSDYSINIDTTVIDTTGKVQDVEEFMEEEVERPSDVSNGSPYTHSGDILKDYPFDYTFVGFKAIGQFYDITQVGVAQATGKFACSVSAMTVLADKLGIAPGATYNNTTMKNTYNKLWTDSKTKVSSTGTSGGIKTTFGTTYDSNLINAMKSLAKSKNKSVNAAQIVKPSFAQMKSYIDANRNFVFGYNVTSGNSGHSVATQGYYQGKKGNATHNFLIVANGWTYGSRYLNFSANEKYMSGTCMTAFW